MTVPGTTWFPTPDGEVASSNDGVERITQDSVTRILQDGTTRVLEPNVVTYTPDTVWESNDP